MCLARLLCVKARSSRDVMNGFTMNMKSIFTVAIAAGVVAGTASADLMWDEAIDGDLSGDYLAPTQLFTKGVNNHVIFETSTGDDREFFTFTIAEGFQLSALIFDDFETDPESNLGFISVNEGSVLPFDPDAPNVTQLLGYYLPGADDVGNDILQLMGQGGGSQGFSGPLAAGTYTFWAQETAPSVDMWDLNFVVTEVPAPGALALLGLAGFAGKRRRS